MISVSMLKNMVNGTGSNFFDRGSMQFFGDTMRNYTVRMDRIDTRSEKAVMVYALMRKQPVKHGLQATTYFRQDTLERVFNLSSSEV